MTPARRRAGPLPADFNPHDHRANFVPPLFLVSRPELHRATIDAEKSYVQIIFWKRPGPQVYLRLSALRVALIR